MTAKNWCCVLLSSAAIAIVIPEKASVASYAPCGYPYYRDADEIIEPTKKAEAYYLAANDCYRSAQRDFRRISSKDRYASGAMKYYTKAIALNPGIAKTYLSYIHLGEIHRENEDYSQSLKNYGLAIALVSNLPRAYNGRARTYALMKQNDLALADYVKAIGVDANAASFLGRGNVYLSLNQKSKAIADYTKAIAIKPNFADAYIVRGNTYRSLKYDRKAIADYSQAITSLKNAIASYSNNNYTSRLGIGLGDKLAKVYLQRAELHRQAANYQQAVRDYQESDFLNPLPAKFYPNRAEAYRQTKQYQKALNEYVKIIFITQPRERAEAYLGMGYAYRGLQQRDLALDNFKRAAYLFEWQGNTAKYQTAIEEMTKL